jgi:hypothetical protein
MSLRKLCEVSYICTSDHIGVLIGGKTRVAGPGAQTPSFMAIDGVIVLDNTGRVLIQPTQQCDPYKQRV